jgi:transposase InsO family protein
MRLHANARTCPHSRRLALRRLEQEGWTLARAAEAAGVSVRTISKWRRRYRVEGEVGLLDRSSAPGSIPHRTPEERVQAIAALRRERLTGWEIAERLGMPLSTVSTILARIGLGRLSRLEPPEPPNRYQRERPGELLHIDVKKLGKIGRPGHRINGDRRTRSRGIGWEYVHVCVDDATRLAYVEVLENEKAVTAVGFLRRAVAHFSDQGIRVERVMTDNGPCYRSTLHALACRALGLHHLRTRPYRPRTNGKAERFIRTMLGRWAYGAIYQTSAQRSRALPAWLDFYNHHRPQAASAAKPRSSDSTRSGTTLLGPTASGPRRDRGTRTGD